MTPFGDDGPWASYRANDLVHLALGGPVMNCGYDPLPDGRYDLPPIAPAAWQSYIIAGEQLVIGILAAVFSRHRTGRGQYLSCAVHEAVAKSTELDLMNWVMRRSPLLRQTARHAAEKVSAVPTIAQTKDGRYLLTMLMGARNEAQVAAFLQPHGIAGDDDGAAEPTRRASGPSPAAPRSASAAPALLDLVQRFVRKHSYDTLPWLEAQAAGVMCAPLRRPHENVADEHWQARGTFAEVEHPELGRSLTYAVQQVGLDRAGLGHRPPGAAARRGHRADQSRFVRTEGRDSDRAGDDRAACSASPGPPARALSALGKPMPLAGIRIFDFSWFLASAGGTRFLAALGAECIKVEWKDSPDTRMAAMAPVGGRAARRGGDRPAARRHRPGHGRPVQQQERGQARPLAQRPAPRGPGRSPGG